MNDGDKNNVIRNLKSLYQDIAQGMNPRPVLEIIDAPATYSADNTDPVSNRLTFSFKVYDPNTPMDDTLKVALYLDRNNDSLYDEKEIVFYQGAEGDRYTMEVKNGRSGTITYDMPQGAHRRIFLEACRQRCSECQNRIRKCFQTQRK